MTAIQAPVRGRALTGGDTGRRPSSRWWIYALLTLGILLMVGPFLWMLLGSLKPEAEFLVSPPTFLPHAATTDNYERLFGKLDFPRFFFNSSLIALVVTAGNVLFCPMLGYALAKLEWRGKRLIMALVLATLMVPAGITLIPNFVLMRNLGLVNTYPGLILPLIASATATFLFRQFFLTVPDELCEAARLDGASPLRFFWSILLPLSVSNIIALAIILFLFGWNQYLWPLLFTTDKDMATAVIALKNLIPRADSEPAWNIAMSGALLTMLPPTLVILLLQRWFLKGLIDSSK